MKRNKNLIGISGKKGSGKDTIALIIQYLTWQKKTGDQKTSYEEYFKLKPGGYTEYTIKSFAEPIKNIVCSLIGCTREQLEDRDFKEKLLDSSWDVWKVREYPCGPNRKQIELGLTYNVEFHRPFLFATKLDAVKFITSNRFPCKMKKIHLSPRKLMALIGTQAGRNIIHPDMWVKALFSKYHTGMIGGIEFLKKDGSSEVVESVTPIPFGSPKWIISDVRFRNEVKAIIKKGGISIRVYKDPKEVLIFHDEHKDRTYSKIEKYDYTQLKHRQQYLQMTKKEHSSETGLDGVDCFHYMINNNGTIPELIEQVRKLLIKEEII